MPAKQKTIFICSECGFESPKWFGQCPGCREWNAMEEVMQDAPAQKGTLGVSASGSKARTSAPIRISEISTESESRYHTGLSELDRVLGGGIVKGSLILISPRDPGIGKSTILLQICEYLGNSLKLLYITGEESKRQIRLRAGRLGVPSQNLYVPFVAETDLGQILNEVIAEKPDLIMVDSIQTMNLSELSSSPGSVSQVRECTNAIMRVSKAMDIPAIIVGHVNKEGANCRSEGIGTHCRCGSVF